MLPSTDEVEDAGLGPVYFEPYTYRDLFHHMRAVKEELIGSGLVTEETWEAANDVIRATMKP